MGNLQQRVIITAADVEAAEHWILARYDAHEGWECPADEAGNAGATLTNRMDECLIALLAIVGRFQKAHPDGLVDSDIVPHESALVLFLALEEAVQTLRNLSDEGDSVQADRK